MISAELPHFLLFAEARIQWVADVEHGTWRFQLQSLDGDDHFAAAGSERYVSQNRLEVLAVLRGLEALDQPSRVTLLTSSRYVQRALRQGLQQWEQSNWQWERFGRRVRVSNHDLWQRVVQTKQFHRIDCRLWRIDSGHDPATETQEKSAPVKRPHFLRRRRLADDALENATTGECAVPA